MTHDLSHWDVPEGVWPRGTDSFIASIGTEARCDGGAIEEVEADAAVD